jgi:hypothetical protein
MSEEAEDLEVQTETNVASVNSEPNNSEPAGRARRSCVVAASSKTPKKEPKKKPAHDDERIVDDNDWVCTVCGLSETFNDDDQLLLCDGPCLRSFHTSCIGSKRKLVMSLRLYLALISIYLLLLCTYAMHATHSVFCPRR